MWTWWHNITKRVQASCRTWDRDLLAAKTHLDDEYTFTPGRYAGQGYNWVASSFETHSACARQLDSEVLTLYVSFARTQAQ
ncbi:hypothetical protein N7523_006136 [Penicillium sp. IBT 18751x]|nr:hypothetical protein N7523_006136 [Penicillium sp. IBT 18751x]